MTLGRTKAQALCENVLASYSVHTHVDYIKENNLHFLLNSRQCECELWEKRVSIRNLNWLKMTNSANCLAHVLHNASKFAAAKMDIDVENIVVKIYSHFSISASRTAQLK